MIEINEKKLLLKGLADLLQTAEDAERLAYLTYQFIDGIATEDDRREAENLANRILGQR